MTKGTQKGDDTDQSFHAVADHRVVSGPPRAGSVIQFPQGRTAASIGLAAGGDLLSPPASFQPIGPVIQAVVMQLKGDRARVKAIVPASDWEEVRRDDL